MRTVNKTRLFYNFFSLGAVQAISSAIQLVVIPHVISKVGVDGYGVIAVAQVVMFYLAVITDYSFNQTATKAIAINRTDPGMISRIFSKVFCTRLVLCLVAFFIFVVLLLLVPFFRAQSFLYIMAFMFVIGHSLLVNWFFLGLEKMHFITYSTLVARVLFAILVFAFITGAGDGYLFLFFLGLSNIVAAVICLVVVIRSYNVVLRWPGAKVITGELKEGWQLTLSHVSNSTCHYLNIFILRFFANDLIVGYYGIAERIFFTIRQVFVVFSQAVYPRLCQVLETGRQNATLFLRKVYTGFLLLLLAGCLILFIFSPQVLYFFIGDNYPHAVFYLRFFCVIAVVVCLNIPGTLLLLAANRKHAYLKIYLIATVVNLTLNLVLAGFYQAKGTVLAILVTELLITVGVTVYAGQVEGPGSRRTTSTRELWDIDKQNI